MKKTIIFALLAMLLLTLCSCAGEPVSDISGGTYTESPEPQTPVESIDPTPSAPSATETDFITLQDILDAAGMPALFTYQGGAENDNFYMPCVEKYYNTGLLADEIMAYLGLTVEEFIEITRSKLAWNFTGALGKTDLLETCNLFSYIIIFDLSDEIVAEIIMKHNEHYESLATGIEGEGWLEYYRSFKFTDAEIEALLSRDEAKVLEQFASEYSVVIGDRVYTPFWLYVHTPEDYTEAGITSEMIEKKLSLYDDFSLTDEAAGAFEDKLSAFTGESVTLKGADER